MLIVADLLATARRRSGLTDFGSMAFEEGLGILVDAINTEAGLDPVIERRVQENLVGLLENRLRMQRDLASHPEILDETILPPVFITSLPRTGSTKLHRMLGATGDFHAMRYWQGLNFAPFRAGDEADPANDPRIAAAAADLEWQRSRSPLFFEAHPMFVDDGEEERLLLNAGFNSLYDHASYMNVPSYAQWVLSIDPLQAFKDMRRILQYLQWQFHRGVARRWILKTPALLGMEGALAAAFPGMDFIVTHRHPAAIMGSVCALLTGIRQVYRGREGRDDDVGAFLLTNFGTTVDLHLDWRERYPAEKVLDIAFDRIVRDEVGTLGEVYRFLKLPLTDAAKRNVEAWVDMDARRRGTPRSFTLQEYGLDAAHVNERFARYIHRYATFL